MMNSGVDDDFPPNPFRSGGSGEQDLFSQQPPPPQQQQQQQFQQPMQQQQPQQFQQPPPIQQQQQQPQQFGGHMQPNNNPSAGFVNNQAGNATMGGSMDSTTTTPQSTPTSWWGWCMACVRIETYKRYFDIDTNDIKMRMIAAMTHFHQPQYFRDQVIGIEQGLTMNPAPGNSELKGPDLYGPFWIVMTLIFFVAVSISS
jgi:hypothetical protein